MSKIAELGEKIGVDFFTGTSISRLDLRRFQQRVVDRNRRLKHPAVIAQRQKQYREQNRDELNEYRRRIRAENLPYELERVKKRRREVRIQALALLGGKCCVCGFSDSRALQIDHIIPVRKKERHRDSSSYHFYCQIVQGETDNLQVLCANCHAIKTFEEGNGSEL